MPTIATSQLPIPKDWNEFEDVCADLFSLIWNDHNTVRYGRAGQRQNGVDIRGQSPRGGIAGVQCKGKRQWPPVKLTTAEIDAEVAKALDFQPPLSEFTIATTALNDGPLQAHVDAITERHRAQGLFSVHLLGWDELCRRITNYDQLVEKHFGLITLSSVRRDIEAVPRLVADNLRELGLVAVPPSGTTTSPGDVDTLRSEFAAALERDFQCRYTQAMQRSMFPEFLKIDLLRNLANEIRDGGVTALSAGLRRSIFLHAARSTALPNAVQDAETFLGAGVLLPGAESELPARARIAEARGDLEDAVRMLREETDADARSVLLSIIARHKGDASALAWFADQALSAKDLTPNGVLALCQIHMRQDNFQAVKQMLSDLTESRMRECPYFLYFRGSCVLPWSSRDPNRVLH